MTDDQLRELAAEIWTLVGSAPRAMTLVSIETLLRQVRDQVTVQTEQRVRRETLDWALKTAEENVNIRELLREELRRAAEIRSKC